MNCPRKDPRFPFEIAREIRIASRQIPSAIVTNGPINNPVPCEEMVRLTSQYIKRISPIADETLGSY